MQRKRFSFEVPWPSLRISRQAIASWLPSRGNVLFTTLMIMLLLWAQTAGAFPALDSSAASTGTIAYQGRLADSGGNPLTTTVNMTFRLYSAATGSLPLWSEDWTGSNGVQVSDGLFNVMLGSLTTIPQSVISGSPTLFLGITAGTDDEMAPRVQLGSVPFAVQALTVPNGSVTTAKIADGAVTQAKLADGGFRIPIHSANTTTVNWPVTTCDNKDYIVPGVISTFNVDKSSVLDVSFTGLVENQKGGGATYTSIFLDGNRIVATSGDNVGGCRNSGQISGDPWCTAANVATIPVTPGSHTVDVRARCDGGTDARGGVWNGWLVIRVFPQ